MQKFKLIKSSEIEDFNTEVSKAGYDPEDFEISEVVSPAPGAETSSAIILSKKTLVRRTYSAGHGSTWVGDSVSDLKVGRFE